MKRTYAAARLLELGPLTFRDFRDITGWPERCAAATREAGACTSAAGGMA
jgi:hypothetical protein